MSIVIIIASVHCGIFAVDHGFEVRIQWGRVGSGLIGVYIVTVTNVDEGWVVVTMG
jgi:hypothetical protein